VGNLFNNNIWCLKLVLGIGEQFTDFSGLVLAAIRHEILPEAE
jgi:hypothetical protein